MGPEPRGCGLWGAQESTLHPTSVGTTVTIMVLTTKEGDRLRVLYRERRLDSWRPRGRTGPQRNSVRVLSLSARTLPSCPTLSVSTSSGEGPKWPSTARSGTLRNSGSRLKPLPGPNRPAEVTKTCPPRYSIDHESLSIWTVVHRRSLFPEWVVVLQMVLVSAPPGISFRGM